MNRIETAAAELNKNLAFINITVEVKTIKGHGSSRWVEIRHKGRMAHIISGLYHNTAVSAKRLATVAVLAHTVN